MEGALVSAAAGALKPVVEKLGALLGDKYNRFKGVRTEIKSLTDELTAMEAFLKKMSEVEYPDEQDKIWMNKVRELSYDMEDSLNEFMLRVNDKSTKADSLLEKIKCSLGKMKTRSNIAQEIEHLMKQVTLLGERNARYRTGEAISKTSNASVDRRALAIFKHTSKLVGIDEPKDKLLKLLVQEDRFASTQQEVKVVSIVGCGGIGKTTLANQVYQELKGKFKLKFDCFAFVSVSRNPDMMTILRTIFSDISEKDYASTKAGDEQHLISQISNFLADKRYFIVVDDIWKVEAWNVIQYAFPMTSDSKIITTTRIKDVAKSCCSSSNSYIYHVRPLSMMHSRELFHMRLFNPEEECPSHLREVSSQILEKCDGSPLAIIALSGLLANKERTEDKWNQVKDSIGRALERNSSVEDMIQILSLSYFDLPHHLKACLLYLSIFPEDYTIDKETLIRMWIAEGFIPIANGYTAEESGEGCFNELVNRSLIQPVEINDIYNNVKSCRVHDTILDFIVCKAIEENFVTLVGIPEHTPRRQITVRRLSLQGGNHGNTMLSTDLELSHVRSLHVVGHSMEIPSLKKFRHLRVLNFKGCHQLENHHLASIGRLFQLRYLDIQGTKVTVLPEQIGDLQYLEMLDISSTGVRELPAAIVRLGKLVHLLTNGFAKFPVGIAKMQALETLDCVCSRLQSCKFLQELGELKNLRKLSLDVSGHFVGGDAMGVNKERDKAIASSLRKLGTHSLRSLVCCRNSSREMERFLVSAANGALKPVMEKLGALLGDNYKRFKRVRTEIKSVTSELTAMHAFLKKMSEVEYPDEQDKIWMNEVRELSYDMEDSLNEFMLQVNDKSTKADSLLEKIKCSLGKMKTRSNIAMEIEHLMKQITLVEERNAKYRTGEAISKTSNASVDPRALAIFKHTSKLVGIDEPKYEVIKLLAHEDRFASTQQEVKVVSIVGYAGIGKTTLANQVYQKLKGQFECFAFISVARNPDMMTILRTILSDITETPYASIEARDEQRLISKIFNFLADKRYFIVVDDIWKVEAWNAIRRAFPMTSRDSRIITTTRIKDVAKSCCSSSNSYIYHVRPLSMMHSRELFHMRLFNPEEECPSHLEEVSSQILKKCEGLPLAIIALSGLLADKERTEDKWNQVKDSIGRAPERNSSIEDMIQILSLSYFDLPHHLKACLNYLSISPTNFTIDKEGLIRIGIAECIAEGFVPILMGKKDNQRSE